MTARAELKDALSQIDVEDDAVGLIFAAMDGTESLAAAVDGETPTEEAAEGSQGAPEVANVFLTAIEATGFRGIGASTKLQLDPGPGLTVIVGRNGSGKSSFAEALEVALTGDSWRWKNKTQEWKLGWRNLHSDGQPRVAMEFLVEGQKGPTRVWREWEGTAKNAADGATIAQHHGEKQTDLEGIGWLGPIDLYKPLLSHSELGVVADNPSSLFDALSGVLGVDDLVDASSLLRKTRLELQAPLKEVKKTMEDDITPRLEASDDERSAPALDAVSSRSWDLDALEATLSHTAATTEATEAHRQAARLTFPPQATVMETIAELKSAVEELAKHEKSASGRSHRIASLLRTALDEHAEHGDIECPVCGGKNLDAEWKEATTQELKSLEEESAAYRQANDRLKSAVASARQLVSGSPPEVAPEDDLSVSVYQKVRELWLRVPEDPGDLANHIQQNHQAMREEVDSLREAAVKAVQEREDAWKPMATALASWVHVARKALEADEKAKKVKAAEDALGKATTEIRNNRFDPISSKSIELWKALRLQSNVDLTEVTLTGTGNQRRVALNVTVDGTEGAALSVVSQGEVNCLALSLFFPRVTLPESPFKFIVIDDPIQAMDPARVDGLAKVFAGVAEDRQLVIFTHDDRLPESLRRLELPHTLLQVTRRPGSVVEIRTRLDPVKQYFLDARSVARDEALPDGLASRVVPGFCRSGIESACIEAVRRRRLSRGEAHSDVEDLFSRNPGTTALAALALFDDENQGSKVLGTINTKWGKLAGDAFNDCKKGAHKGFSGSLESLVTESQSLAERLRLV